MKTSYVDVKNVMMKVNKKKLLYGIIETTFPSPPPLPIFTHHHHFRMQKLLKFH